MKRLLDYKETSEILGVSTNTLYVWVARKKIPFYRFSDRTVRFDPTEIHTFIKQAKRGSHKREEGEI